MMQIANQRGQLSIFLGILLVIVITLIAFIVNVGLFVKAKINLQNAVDAAAWSGAAVQARQLTNISYLNWEMRNTYKEWMFKYYVLGQKALPRTDLAMFSGGGTAKYEQPADHVNFRAVPFILGGGGTLAVDKFNAPSICLHFGGPSTHNICKFVAIPGLPHFESQGIIGISEHAEGFLNSIIESKVQDCAKRTVLNFMTALTWAYGTGNAIFASAPQIASDRMGAWSRNIELAMRMRNLEMVVNRAPIENGICVSGSSCTPANSLESEGADINLNERPLKAFWSGLRNLDVTMKNSFVLYELAPKLPAFGESSLHNMLIPLASPERDNASKKYYLDLVPYPLNIATFFTSFVAAEPGQFGTSATTTEEGNCAGSKTAIPVPGFMMGFYKNPEVVTYYSVKGEAEFTGLFFPFAGDSIKLKAYATAKPFGGRIGPKLFEMGADAQTIVARSDANFQKSLPYIAGLEPSSDWNKGDPIPISTNFWATTSDDIIGGDPVSQASNIRFVLPNMIYDIGDDPASTVASMGEHQNASEKLEILQEATSDHSAQYSIEEKAGLYDKDQFKALARNFLGFEAEEITKSIYLARQPTRYDALNYLVPTVNNQTVDPPIESPSFVPAANDLGDGLYQYAIFAPLISASGIYKEAAHVTAAISDFIDANDGAIDTYLESLKEVSEYIKLSASPGQDFTAAAATIWADPVGTEECDSLAGRFHQFYRGIEEGRCGITTLKAQMTEYIVDLDADKQSYLIESYLDPLVSANPRVKSVRDLLSAYMPGPRQGASEAGELVHPFMNSEPDSMARRNFYSTKFISTYRVMSPCPAGDSCYNTKGVLQENGSLGGTDVEFKNALSTNAIGELREFFDPTNHYPDH